MEKPSDGPGREPGPFRGLMWCAGALHWSFGSKAGWRALMAASVPWLACSVLNLPTAGLALMIGVAMHAQACAWSALCAKQAFSGLDFDFPAAKRDWSAGVSAMKASSLAFAAIAASGLAWTQLCVQATGLSDMFQAIGQSTSGQASLDLLEVYWAKEGLDGIALGLAAQQLGLAALCAIWCLIPFKAISEPSLGAKALLAFGWSRWAKAPFAMTLFGAVGSLMAQASLAMPPLSLASGLWFLACAFAMRELD